MSRVRDRRRLRRRSAAELTARAARAPTPESTENSWKGAGELEPETRPSLPFELAEETAPDVAVDGATPDAREHDDSGTNTELEDRHMPEPNDAAVEARASAQDQLTADPEEPERSAEDLLQRAARQATAQGNTSRALGIYRELLTLNPRNVPARNNLGLLLDQTGEHEMALEELDQCLEHEPHSAQVLVNRGAVLGAVGRYVDAEQDLRTVLLLEPANAEAHLNLGLVISRKGLWREAVPYLRRAIELDSSRAGAYFYLGEALNHVDDLEGALQSYQRAAELRPNSPNALYGLGIVLDRLNRPEEAAQMYRRSRELAGQ